MRSLIPTLIASLLTGCATSDHYNAQREQIAAWERVQVARAQADARRYDALGAVARDGSDSARIAVALALAGLSGVREQARDLPTPVVTDPNENILRWASIIVPGVTQLASVGFGYKLGAIQSDNAAATSIAGYQTMGGIASAGFASNATIAGFIQAPAANITTTTSTSTSSTNTLSGTGVLGSGSYTTRSCNGGTGGAGSPAGSGAAGTC
jgi:hypothetical protein